MWMDAHEVSVPNPLAERVMDLHNNQNGRDLANDPANDSRDPATVIRESLANGEGQTTLPDVTSTPPPVEEEQVPGPEPDQDEGYEYGDYYEYNYDYDDYYDDEYYYDSDYSLEEDDYPYYEEDYPPVYEYDEDDYEIEVGPILTPEEYYELYGEYGDYNEYYEYYEEGFGEGDPHMTGFDGSDFMFKGDTTHVFDILSDRNFKLEAGLMMAETGRTYFNMFMVQSFNSTVQVLAGTGGEPAQGKPKPS